MTGTILFVILFSTVAALAILKLRNGTMMKILERLTDMLGESKNISQVHKFLLKRFKILNEIELDSYDVDNDVRADPKSGTAYIVNEAGILNYAFFERMKTPLDQVLSNGTITVRSYKWSSQHNGNEYINCYFTKNKLVGMGYTFYPLESAGNELKSAITSRRNMINDLMQKKLGKPKEELMDFKQVSFFLNDDIFSSTFLAFCGSTLFLFKKGVLKESFIGGAGILKGAQKSPLESSESVIDETKKIVYDIEN
jgi:hypothetical protein